MYTALNSAYWIEIESKQPTGILIKNLATVGKKKVKMVREVVEESLIYPLIQGRNVAKWHGIPEESYIVVPHDERTGKPLEKGTIKLDFPNTYKFLLQFQTDLEKRPIHKLWGKRNPFYALYDIGEYTFKPYKVMWKYVAGKISGKGAFSVAVVEPVEDEHFGKRVVIPNEKLMLIPFDDRDEAHYVASVLNSPVAQLIVMGYTIETAISTHVLKNVYVPKFKPKDKVHLKLAELSKNAHELAKRYYELKDLEAREELKDLEEEIDKIVAELYGITDEELEEVRRTLRVLRGEDVEELEKKLEWAKEETKMKMWIS